MAERRDVHRPIRRATVPLVRGDLWDPTTLRQRAAGDAERRLLRDYVDADETGYVRGSATPTNPLGRHVTEEQAAEARRRLAEGWGK
jgi:hypothetical protein